MTSLPESKAVEINDLRYSAVTVKQRCRHVREFGQQCCEDVTDLDFLGICDASVYICERERETDMQVWIYFYMLLKCNIPLIITKAPLNVANSFVVCHFRTVVNSEHFSFLMHMCVQSISNFLFNYGDVQEMQRLPLPF